jgi:hypothetical protein
VGPRAGLDVSEKSRPHRDFFLIRFPDRPARNQALYRLSYPAHVLTYTRTHTYGPRDPQTHFALYLTVHCPLSQYRPPDPISCKLSHIITTLPKHFTMWKLRLNPHKIKTILFFKRRTPFPHYIQIPNTFLPRTSSDPCPFLLLDSKPLFTRHLHTFPKKLQTYSVTFSPCSSETQRSNSPTC